MNRIMAILSGILLFSFIAPPVSAQSGYEVKGFVLDQVGPIVGATVVEQGTSNGTSTGLDGEYKLSVSSAESIVEISCIGYKTQIGRAHV